MSPRRAEVCRATILFVSHTSAWGGGAEIVLDQIVRAARHAGYDAILACPRGQLVDRVGPHCSAVHTVDLPRLRRTGNPLVLLGLITAWCMATVRLASVIRRRQAAIVHANSAVAALCAAVPAALLRRPLVWHQHDIVPPRTVNRLLFGLCGRLTAAVVPCSRAVACSMTRLGVAEPKVHVLYNCVRPQFLTDHPDPIASRRALGLPAHTIVACVVGRLVPRKGQDVFLRALSSLRGRGLDVHGALLGDTPAGSEYAGTYAAYRTELERLASRPDLQGHVSFLGYRDDVRSVLAASDIVVLPSSAEPFPLAVLEAFAAGRPVVASDAGGHPEMIEHGVTGFLAPFGDHESLAKVIEILASDPELRDRMGHQARALVRSRFHEDDLAPRLAAIYVHLLPRALEEKPALRGAQ